MKFIVSKAIANIGGKEKEIKVVYVAGVKIRVPVKVLPKNQK